MRPIDADALFAQFDTSDRKKLLRQVLAKAPCVELVPMIMEMTIEVASVTQEAIKNAPTLTDEELGR